MIPKEWWTCVKDDQVYVCFGVGSLDARFVQLWRSTAFHLYSGRYGFDWIESAYYDKCNADLVQSYLKEV